MRMRILASWHCGASSESAPPLERDKVSQAVRISWTNHYRDETSPSMLLPSLLLVESVKPKLCAPICASGRTRHGRGKNRSRRDLWPNRAPLKLLWVNFLTLHEARRPALPRATRCP